jgi:hypothetical protein
MSTKPKEPKRVVTLGLKGLTVPQLIQNSRHYVLSMTGNPYFPTPTPALASITAQTDQLEKDYAISLTRVKGSVGVMRAEEKKLITLNKTLASYVEMIANGNPPPGTDVIPKAGMVEKKTAVKKPKGFSVIHGPVMGEVILNSKSVKNVSTAYQMSTDPNNAALWQTIYMGIRVKFAKTGLTTGTRYYFRMAVTSKGVQGNWSAPIDLLVV